MTPEQRAAMERGLEALKNFARFQRMMMDGPDVSDKMLAEDYAETGFKQMVIAITAMTAALADNALAGKESVATGDTSSERVAKTPKKAHEKSVEWRGLTLEQKHQLNDALNLQGRFAVIDAIEAKLKELNT